MTSYPSDAAFTESVKAIQTVQGSRAAYARVEQGTGWQTTITPELATYIAGLDMFYLGTSNAAGQPYIQYRGGPPGFLKVTGNNSLAFADFAGNRQYITLGNLAENPRAFLFLIDYTTSRRIKLWGSARVVDEAPELLERLTEPDYKARVERAIVFEVETWDVNCPQHIHKRFPQSAVAPIIEQLQQEIRSLQAQLEAR